MNVMPLEKKPQKVRLVGMVVGLILVILLGCNFPQRILTPSPVTTIVPGSVTPDISSTHSPSPVKSSVPTLPQVSQTEPPQNTPAIPTSTIPSPLKIPTQYDLVVVLDYESHSLTVVESISYVNLSSTVLTNLLLVVEPNLIPGGFNLTALTWVDGESVGQFDLNENQLSIPLPQPLQPDGQLGIELKYMLYLPQLADASVFGRPEAYGYSDHQTNLVDWYPYIPPFDNDLGWIVHQPTYFGEYQVYGVSDYDIDLSLAQPISDLVIAASATAIQEGEHNIYHQETARNFVFSVSTEYLVQTTTIAGVTITSYSFPFDKSAAQEALNNTADALRSFSHLIMPYPRSSLSIVEADFLDGMEYDGLFFLSYGFYNLYDGTPRGYLTFIAAHETAHQWWYALVGNDQAMEPWLDEALSTYMELIFYQNNYVDYSPPSGGSLPNWWWYYRVYFYDPTGWVDSSIYDFDDPRPYRNAVYLRGAIFLDELRNLIGDQTFFAFLRDYAQTNAYSLATSNNFFTILRRHTSQDLYGLINTYFHSIR